MCILGEECIAVLVIFGHSLIITRTPRVLIHYRRGDSSWADFVILTHLVTCQEASHRMNIVDLTVFSTICLASSCQSFASMFPAAISAACSSGPPHTILM